jgi:hypothetical protein
MRYILLPLFFISLPLFAANILNYEIQENDTQNIEILLSLDDNWNSSVEQKNDDENIVFIFENLQIKSSIQKSQNHSVIEYINFDQMDADKLRLTIKSKQVFDADLLSGANVIRISLTPKTIPLTMESIANSANSGNFGYILDILLYVIIFLAFLCTVFFVLVKFKLFSNTHVKTDDVKNNTLHAEDTVDTSDKKQSEPENTNNTEDMEQGKNNVHDAKQSKKDPKSLKGSKRKPVKKPKQTKSLFDL